MNYNQVMKILTGRVRDDNFRQKNRIQVEWQRKGT
jgi:hypothetical protein